MSTLDGSRMFQHEPRNELTSLEYHANVVMDQYILGDSGKVTFNDSGLIIAQARELRTHLLWDAPPAREAIRH